MSRRKLLLADDSVTIQKVVNLTFADEGIDVVTVGDGDSAIDKIAEMQPDLVLADVHMPGLNGYQICEIIRGNEATKHMPVVLLVGSFEPFDEVEAERVGANAFLTKPFQSIRQLVSQVSELMESAAAQAVETNGTAAVAASDPEIEDIDNLYHQSFSKIEIPADVSERYADAGLDDEIIETSYASGGIDDNVIDFEIGITPESDVQLLHNEQSFADIFEPEQQAPETPYRIESAIPAETEITEPEPREQTEDHLSEPYGSDNQSVEQTEPSVVEDAETETAETAETETADAGWAFTSPDALLPLEPIGHDTVRMDERFETNSSAELDFEEIDLLEIPDFPEGTTLELTTPVDAIEAGGSKQVVSLAPELIEMIAQRVVEKLSEKY